jgi:hypothetical protein
MTGSKFFPGGLGTYSNYALSFENGPALPVTLQWASYYDAADQAGISRIWGGIHPPIDNWQGRRAGAEVGKGVWALAQKYFDGSVANTPVTLALGQSSPGTTMLSFNTLRGLYYKVQSTTSLDAPFTDEPGGATQALEGWITRTNQAVGPQEFFRVSTSLTP